MLKEQFYDTGQIRINCAIGPATGPPLLLLHGVTANWQSFLPIIPGLSQNHQIFAIDLRGHGLSGKIEQGYTLVDYSSDVLQFVQSELGTSIAILGHSFGALIAIHVAANVPEFIQSIILLDPPLIYRTMAIKNSPSAVDQEAYQWFSTAYDIIRSNKSVDEVENSLQSMFPSWPAKSSYVLAQRLNQMDPDVLGMLINHQHMEGYNTDKLLKQVTCPVLVFQGNRSRGAALTAEDAQFLRKKLSKCTVIRLEDAGHNVHETHSKEIVERVIKFLADLPSTTTRRS
jgi:pimeloyl-ACP methyl ester carboxylesterase